MSAYGTTRNHAGSAFATSASITLFRRLSWEGTVPLEIRVDPKELPANSDRGLECYYIQAPRVSYLPLLMPELRRFLMDIVFDEAAGKLLKEEDWWFESEEGTLLKWYAASFFHQSCRRIPVNGGPSCVGFWRYGCGNSDTTPVVGIGRLV